MADSIYKTILDEVNTALGTISFTGLPAGRIKLMKMPVDREAELPGIPGIIFGPVLAPRVITGVVGDTNERDVIAYPVGIVAIQAGNQDQSANFDRFLKWQEQIRQKFINQRVDAVDLPQVYTCTIEPRDSFDPASWFTKNLDVGGMVLRFHSRETRG